jgi:hypothetical protein
MHHFNIIVCHLTTWGFFSLAVIWFFQKIYWKLSSGYVFKTCSLWSFIIERKSEFNLSSRDSPLVSWSFDIIIWSSLTSVVSWSLDRKWKLANINGRLEDLFFCLLTSALKVLRYWEHGEHYLTLSCVKWCSRCLMVWYGFLLIWPQFALKLCMINEMCQF